MTFDVQPVPLLRLLAWLLTLGIGLRASIRHPDAAGRAMALWFVIWAGGIQSLLSLQAMATDPATQQVLYRAAYYAVLFSTSSFLVVLAYLPRPAPRLHLLVAGLLGAAVLAGFGFAGNHGAFIAETVDGAGYGAINAGLLQVAFPAVVWTGFLAGMAWLAWRAPAWDGAERRTATWLMAGLGLFAADRFARTAALWLRDPTTLGPGTEGAVYGLYMMAFGIAVAALVYRARAIREGANVQRSVLVGAAVGATAVVTFGLGGSTTVPVLMSALLGPVYGALFAQALEERHEMPATVPAPEENLWVQDA